MSQFCQKPRGRASKKRVRRGEGDGRTANGPAQSPECITAVVYRKRKTSLQQSGMGRFRPAAHTFKASRFFREKENDPDLEPRAHRAEQQGKRKCSHPSSHHGRAVRGISDE